jgi:type IV pilus assembly protein PilN
MISINLLPGSGKKSRGRSLPGVNIGALFAGVVARIKDPFLIGAVAACAVSIAAIAGLYVTQTARAAELTSSEQKAVQDSTRYAAVLKEKRKAESQRDSMLMQIKVIRAIDDNRFIWPHILDEVSRALPPYTWLTQVTASSTGPVVAAPAKAGTKGAAPDSAAIAVPLTFQLVGNTVDIQALTRFMRLLEASPFIKDVEMRNTTAILVEGREITQFTLGASYQDPDSSVIRTVPITLSVR